MLTNSRLFNLFAAAVFLTLVSINIVKAQVLAPLSDGRAVIQIFDQKLAIPEIDMPDFEFFDTNLDYADKCAKKLGVKKGNIFPTIKDIYQNVDLAKCIFDHINDPKSDDHYVSIRTYNYLSKALLGVSTADLPSQIINPLGNKQGPYPIFGFDISILNPAKTPCCKDLRTSEAWETMPGAVDEFGYKIQPFPYDLMGTIPNRSDITHYQSITYTLPTEQRLGLTRMPLQVGCRSFGRHCGWEFHDPDLKIDSGLSWQDTKIAEGDWILLDKFHRDVLSYVIITMPSGKVE